MGVGPEGLGRKALDLLDRCSCVAAASRYRNLIPPGKEIVPIAPLKSCLSLLKKRSQSMDVAVLAGGDPLFFGIGRSLLEAVGKENVTIIPALSSAQLAFANFKEPWDDATFVSLHGRKTDHLLPLILPHDKVLIFTDQHNTPDLICRTLLNELMAVDDEETINSYHVMVGENLGLAEEKLTTGTLAEIAGKQFDSLNILLLKRAKQKSFSPLGLQTHQIRHSRGLITKDEVRAASLHKLNLPKTGVFWDIGAGSGSISIEASRLCPSLAVFAIERHEEELANIKANIKKFNCHHVTIVPGTAPDNLANLAAPDRIFIGGSGGRLQEIIQYAASRLAAGGIMVVNGVIRKTIESTPSMMAEEGFSVDISTIAVTCCKFADKKEIQFNPVAVIRGVKPS
jgi:precorrin-6Y C5,15-methyltransferase (decarboxylating)